MVYDSIINFNEEEFLFNQGYARTNYNGIVVYYNGQKSGYFYESHNRKSKIVIHHTAGGLVGDLATLTNPSVKVSVPFLISPQGRIIMLYKPWNWSYHLGKNALGGNLTQSKLSIGIELSNWGFLIPYKGYMYTYRGSAYCSIADTTKYTVGEPWKMFNKEKVSYFANYTDEQYKSLKTLKNLLCQLYGIPDVKFPLGGEYSREVVEFEGLCTHTNFRIDKYDLSPNFDWKKIFD